MYSTAQQRGYRDTEYEAAKRHDLTKKAGKTAIHRRNASLPTRWLRGKGLIGKMVLDYGCGKGADVDYLNQFDHIAYGYDPNHRQEIDALGYDYDTVICQYVLNVVQKSEIIHIINKVRDHLCLGGVAYFTVRRDIKKEGYTSKGTYQRNVVLDLPIERETSTYCIYKLENEG